MASQKSSSMALNHATAQKEQFYDFLMSLNSWFCDLCCACVLLDLTAAFNTIDQQILLFPIENSR